ncbi:MAG: hypothetical protein K0Q63_2146 [Paenibacillus sp.]|nr:hypothetical protein [Paenibacillus sp.]
MPARRMMLILTAIMTLLLASCTASGNTERPDDSATSPPTASEQPTQKPAATDQTNQEERYKPFDNPRDAAAAAIEALKESDAERLKAYIHPAKGVLFSPYAHIDADKAVSFAAEEFPEETDDAKHVWGSYDGSGEPIELTFGDYYKKFVYDKDFANAEQIGYDKILGQGNTEPNIKDVYPGSYTVDYHFSGFDEEFKGMDWESLILVLEEHQGGWYVCAIVHSQWTI